jgi:hypothetical protein
LRRGCRSSTPAPISAAMVRRRAISSAVINRLQLLAGNRGPRLAKPASLRAVPTAQEMRLRVVAKKDQRAPIS